MERHNQIKQILRENAPYAYRDDYRPLVQQLSPGDKLIKPELRFTLDTLNQLDK